MAKTLHYPSDVGTGVYKSYVHFTLYNRFNAAQSDHRSNISLYMPENLTQPSTISWDSSPIGIIGDTMVKTGLDKTRAMEMLNKTFEGAFYNAMSKGASMFGGNITAEDLRGAYEGKITNPYLTILFKGIDFRTFQFTFKFIPHSEKECTTIFNILQEFRQAALPEKTENGAYLGYPCELDIQYMSGGDKNKWLHSFKRCIIKEIDINYTGSGQWTVLRNGFPAETVLNMTLTEREIVDRTDIEKGY